MLPCTVALEIPASSSLKTQFWDIVGIGDDSSNNNTVTDPADLFLREKTEIESQSVQNYEWNSI